MCARRAIASSSSSSCGRCARAAAARSWSIAGLHSARCLHLVANVAAAAAAVGTDRSVPLINMAHTHTHTGTVSQPTVSTHAPTCHLVLSQNYTGLPTSKVIPTSATGVGYIQDTSATHVHNDIRTRIIVGDNEFVLIERTT